ncbi:hypothetical protein C8T65DRAFT_654966 [Cerioporus squamosus]|nr:hypothetical protein C8T65DRAFT_654966 [Cerioporus squamosus]
MGGRCCGVVCCNRECSASSADQNCLIRVNVRLDHGNEWCRRKPTKDVIFCFDKHSG